MFVTKMAELTVQRRAAIENMAKQGYRTRCIANTLDVHPRVVTQALKRSPHFRGKWREKRILLEAHRANRHQENRAAFALGAPPCYQRGGQNVILPIERCEGDPSRRYLDKRDETGGVDYDQVRGMISREEWLEREGERSLRTPQWTLHSQGCGCSSCEHRQRWQGERRIAA